MSEHLAASSRGADDALLFLGSCGSLTTSPLASGATEEDFASLDASAPRMEFPPADPHEVLASTSSPSTQDNFHMVSSVSFSFSLEVSLS